jgi:hypothetical protein
MGGEDNRAEMIAEGRSQFLAAILFVGLVVASCANVWALDYPAVPDAETAQAIGEAVFHARLSSEMAKKLLPLHADLFSGYWLAYTLGEPTDDPDNYPTCRIAIRQSNAEILGFDCAHLEPSILPNVSVSDDAMAMGIGEAALRGRIGEEGLRANPSRRVLLTAGIWEFFASPPAGKTSGMFGGSLCVVRFRQANGEVLGIECYH